MLQLRQEMGIRVCDKVFDPTTDKPSKVNDSRQVHQTSPIGALQLINLFFCSGGCVSSRGSLWIRAYLHQECRGFHELA